MGSEIPMDTSEGEEDFLSEFDPEQDLEATEEKQVPFISFVKYKTSKT